MGLCGHALGLFRSYLSERTQFESIEGVLSELSELVVVLKVLCLEPLNFSYILFLLVPFSDIITFNIYIYADDTPLYCSFDETPFFCFVKAEVSQIQLRPEIVKSIGSPVFTSN